MNRPKLFRGKKINSDQWVCGYHISHIVKLGKTIHKDHCIVDHLTGLTWEVFPDTVGLCTGLKDMHGKEVCEGDVLRTFDLDNDSPAVGMVIFERGGFVIEWLNCKARVKDFITDYVDENGNFHIDFEILGNIHQHAIFENRDWILTQVTP